MATKPPKASKKLEKAVAGLHKELGKLDPKSRAAIHGHLETIHAELRATLAGIEQVKVFDVPWKPPPLT